MVTQELLYLGWIELDIQRLGNGLYLVGRNLFLLLLNFSVWPCLPGSCLARSTNLLRALCVYVQLILPSAHPEYLSSAPVESGREWISDNQFQPNQSLKPGGSPCIYFCSTDFPAYSDTLGTKEKCHCNQIVTLSRDVFIYKCIVWEKSKLSL